MTLQGKQVEQFCDALLSAFDMPQLRRMVRYELDQKLEQIAGGKDDSDVVFELVSWAESVGREQELLQVAYAKKPSNEKLRAIANQLCPKSSPALEVAAVPQARFPEACEFDLIHLMDEAIDHCESKQGLVGLVIPYLDEAFRVSFCERLKRDLGRRNVVIRQPLQIDAYVSVDERVAKIQRYGKALLRDRDVICPMPISIVEPSSTLPDELWSKLSEAFKDIDSNRRLILFMYGREHAIFPTGLRHLNAPQFKGGDVRRWVVRMADMMGWQEHVWQQWRQHMMECCCDGDDATDALDIRAVYEHLEFSMSLLQRRLPSDQFLQELKSGF